MSFGPKTKRAEASQTSTKSNTASATAKYPRFGKRGAPQAFPSKLYEILEGENPEIVGWTETGRGFEVRDHARLSSEVLGRFFKQDKFSSFQRQLNLYGFRKITKGTEAGSYQHPHFRRGERTTLLSIRRSTKASPARTVSGQASCAKPDPVATALAGAKGRPATPSPPPKPVARGVLPWPRQPAALPSLPSEVRDTRGPSPTNASVGGGSMAMTVNGHVGNIGVSESCGGGRGVWDQRQQKDHAEPAGTWAAQGGGGGEFAKSNGSHGGSGGGWASADQVGPESEGSSRRWDATNKWEGMMGEGTSGNECCNIRMDGQVESKGDRTAEREPEKAEGLDREDVEVVGLLQRMAKEAQDSPSRAQIQAPDQTSATKWDEQNANIAARPQPFRMPRPQAAPVAHRQGEQTAGNEHIYEVLNRERESVASRSTFVYGTGESRSGFPHPPHARLPAPFPTITPDTAPRMEPFNTSRSGLEPIVNDRFPRPTPGHTATENGVRDGNCNNTKRRPFEPEMGSRPNGGGEAFRTALNTTPSSYPAYGLERQCRAPYDSGVERLMTDMGVHRASWHGPGGPYVAALSQYHGDIGTTTDVDSMDMVTKAEVPWSAPRSCEGGRRIVH